MRHVPIITQRIKKKILDSIFLMIMIVESFSSHGQNSVPGEDKFSTEKARFIQNSIKIPGDTAVIFPVTRNFISQVSVINMKLDENKVLTIIDREKAKRSVVYFLQEINKGLTGNKIHLYELNNAVVTYNNVLNAILQHKPFQEYLKSTSQSNTQLVAASFTQYKEFALLDDIATFKRIAATPTYIFPFLETKPNFRFADSLLYYAVISDPMALIYYLRKNEPVLQQRINHAGNSYVRAIASLSAEKNANEYAVFANQLSQDKISADTIMATRMAPSRYFQLLVNTLSDTKNNPSAFIQTPLHNAIKEKAIAFYVNPVNELHNANDGIRFAAVNGLRPQDLYFIITHGGEELYTSSYLGLYKRLVEGFEGRAIDSLMQLVQSDNLHTFIRMAASYNTLDDFLHRLSDEKRTEVLQLFISNIEMNTATALEKAMDIADCFGALGKAGETRALIQTEIAKNLKRCIAKQHFLGIRLYSILSGMLELTNDENGMKNLWKVLGDYEVLKKTSLQDAENNISEVVLFYGDEDGVASFNNFLQHYTDKSKWSIAKNENWVTITSVINNKFTIFANRPLAIDKQYDLAAQDSLYAYLKEKRIEVSIMVHRGHSFHLEKTLNRLTPSVKLSVLGSCGSYNKSISIASINPDIQVTGSKKTGSKAVNDPILDIINETISRGNDIVWPDIWAQLTARFKKDETTLNMFNEYFPPSHNLGLFVLKLYYANKSIK